MQNVNIVYMCICMFSYSLIFLDISAGLEVSETDSLLRKDVDDSSDVISVNNFFTIVKTVFDEKWNSPVFLKTDLLRFLLLLPY